MTTLRLRVWRMLLWDALCELASGSRRPVCGDSPKRGLLECERRAGHGGKHAMTDPVRRIDAVWGRSR